MKQQGTKTTIPVEIFHGQVDANTPLFSRDPGWLKKLQNMRVKPGGYLEARGGYEGLRPAGGTISPIDTTTEGFIAGFHQHVSTTGIAIPTADNGVTWGRDVSIKSWFRLFGPIDGVNGNSPVVGTNVDTTGHYWAFGSIQPFSRMTFNIGQGTGGAYSITWEYRSSSGGGSWQPLSLTSANQEFKTAGITEISWEVPSDWVAYALGDGPDSVEGHWQYWVRARVSTIGASAAESWNNTTPILSDWVGKTQLIAARIDPPNLGNVGILRMYGQTNALVALWTQPNVTSWVDPISNFNSRYRFMDYQNTPMFVNGYTQRRFNGYQWREIGFTPPVFTLPAVNVVASGNNFGKACTFRYYISYGYGPNGTWGESNTVLAGQNTFAAGDQAQVTWTLTSPSPDVDVIYLYRSQDLTGVGANEVDAVPAFRIQTLPRSVVGALTSATPVIDFAYAFPFPEFPMSLVDNTPPSRCKFIVEHQGRVFIAGSERFPNRGWWSKAGEGESFDQEENYVELIYPITGVLSAFNTIYVWSEKEMVGISDLDEDVPNIFQVPGGVGCVAGDAIGYKYGVAIWPASDGIYLMTQEEKPERVTLDQSAVFGKMSTLTHGGSRAQMHSSLYEIDLLTPSGVQVGSAPRWRFDLLKPHWNESTVVPSPLAVITAPLGHADFGAPHVIYGNVNASANATTPYVGEYTTADAGTGYDCIGDIHFGPPRLQKFKPWRLAAYYQADSGWGTPVISEPGTLIWSPAGTYGTVVPKVGTDYKVAIANRTPPGSGAQDIVVRFRATSAAGGAVGGQRLIAAYLEGEYDDIHPTP